jgi:uncharacterized protein
MRIASGKPSLSASDLANHLGCRHLTFLDLAVTRGELAAPATTDAALEALQERGAQHEAAYVEHLKAQGLSIVRLSNDVSMQAAFEQARAAMRDGPDGIVQATLWGDGWLGRADILRRVETPSANLGGYSYEVLDTKLARETRGRTILQLCLYSDLLGQVQGLRPERMHVVPPGVGFEPESFRVDDYMAYYRLVRRRLETAVGSGAWAGEATYPDPCEQCDICRWWRDCDGRRRDDDHLSLVAGISKMQIAELQARSVETLESLASITLPLDPKPSRGSAEGYERIHDQARVQFEGRERKTPVHEMLPLEAGLGLFRLPEPASVDVFFDFEGARFAGDEGLEYLFGVVSLDEAGAPQYEPLWALTPADEKAAFERFIDEAMARWEADEGFHIYHYAPYEPSAIKRLMGRHATREDEVDRLLRGERFVDLYAIVKQSLRASVEKYSLKDLEAFFGYVRHVDLRVASRNLQAVEVALEFEAPGAITPEIRDAVAGYNRDDCLATLHLRNWLEGLRRDLVDAGQDIARPPLLSGEASDELDEALTRVRELAERLTRDVPVDRRERTDEQQARWILAQLLEWHRREDKAVWWEFFRLADLTGEELLDERAALAGLAFVERVDLVGRGSVVDRYRYPMQETKIRPGDKLRQADAGAEAFGDVVATDPVARTLDIRKGPKIAAVHPVNVFTHDAVRNRVLRDALLRLGDWVAGHGIDDLGAHRAARDLLLGQPPRLRSGPIERVVEESVDTVSAARRLALDLDGGVLPIQGPPGSGKTYTGARMVCEAVREGKKVGITAVSHKVIRNLIEAVVEAAAKEGLDVRCIEKVADVSEEPNPAILETKDNAALIERLQNDGADVGAGTAWLWAREEAFEVLDVLFVDEAGQMSLANVLAVAQSARSLVLLGDPQQLEQPQRGSHPDGTDVSALEHLLGEHLTLPPDRGVFLGTTWRLHPAICAFTSELFYEGRLRSFETLRRQEILGDTAFGGAGLWHVPVEHEGNQNASHEEVDAVASLVAELTDGGTSWRDKEGVVRRVDLRDILVVAPYNAQVAALLERLPSGARVGTVDKFQGQEAPIVIYSMATSSPEEAPRGMEFLYSLSRLNVATSRARCACILVANPRLFEPECRTPRQMKLANAFCRYLEMAHPPRS